MSQRAQIAIVATVIVLLLLGMVGTVVLLGFNTEGEEATHSPLMVGSILVALGLAALFFMGVLMRLWMDQSTSLHAHEELAESEFERSILMEMRATTSPTPPLATAEAAPSSPPPAPQPKPHVAAEAPGLEGLLTKLRVARIDPKVEGIVQAGSTQGATILRLDDNTVALALTRAPEPGEWAGLFPRYDRVFIPLDASRWIAVERLEGLIASRMGDPL